MSNWLIKKINSILYVVCTDSIGNDKYLTLNIGEMLTMS